MLPYYRDPETKIQIYYTPDAVVKIGVDKVPQFSEALKDMVAALDAEKAYVSKVGEHLAVVVLLKNGWILKMRGGR